MMTPRISREVQSAAIRLFVQRPCPFYRKRALIVAPLLLFLLPFANLSTSRPQCQDFPLGPRPAKFTPLKPNAPDPSSPLCDLDNPPAAQHRASPFLNIIVPPKSTSRVPKQQFNPSDPAYNALTGNRVSSSEKEIFSRLFDQLLTLDPVPVTGRRRQTQGTLGQYTGSGTTTQRGEVPSAIRLHDSALLSGPAPPVQKKRPEVYLTREELNEYPASTRGVVAATFPVKELFELEMEELGSVGEVLFFLEEKVFKVMGEGKTKDRGKEVKSLYGLILLKAMKLFRTKFASPLVGITLFLRVKGLSAESYVLGCTTPLYNEYILARWERYTDLQSIIDVLDEMNMNGLNPNQQTLLILNMIQDEVRQWHIEGNDIVKMIWLAEKDRATKLDKIVRDWKTAGRIISEGESDNSMKDAPFEAV
jgi:Mtf2 family